MEEFMGRCLPRCLVISFLIIILGLGFLWFGWKPQPSSSPPPSPVAESRPIATTSATFGIEGAQALVTKVVDGDTIELENSQTVRLIGIDTPETVDPRRPVGCFGKEAKKETASLLNGKAVILQKDVSETDKYGRLLRYVFLPLDNGDIVFVNKYLLLQGFAKALTYPPDVKFSEEFRQAEQDARINKKGLWDRC